MAEPTAKELTEIFEEVVDLDGVNVDASSILGSDIPVDSKEMLMILSRIESRYGFRLNPGDTLGIKTFGDVLDIVRRETARVR